MSVCNVCGQTLDVEYCNCQNTPKHMFDNGDGKAMKERSGKFDLSHETYFLSAALSAVRDFGMKKYARNNWHKGFTYTESIAAAMRHLRKFNDGETHDPESGLPHPWHALADIEHLIMDMIFRPENDDRSKHLKELLDGHNIDDLLKAQIKK